MSESQVIDAIVLVIIVVSVLIGTIGALLFGQNGVNSDRSRRQIPFALIINAAMLVGFIIYLIA